MKRLSFRATDIRAGMIVAAYCAGMRGAAYNVAGNLTALRSYRAHAR
jgi:hypothetical protein